MDIVLNEPRVGLHGRKRIYSKYTDVNDGNILETISRSVEDYEFNKNQIDYLWKYYRGFQPILNRTKDVRPEICNRIVENHAQECVNFKIGYQLSDPIQYISRAGKDDGAVSESIKLLNDLMFAEDKASSDHDLFEWLCVCGVGYRYVDIDRKIDYVRGGAPFRFHVLDPRNVFVVYSPDYDHMPLLNVMVSEDEQGRTVYDCFGRSKYWKVINATSISATSDNALGLHIIEYTLNNARMGVFEPVLPILDAINAIESNRLDGIEQTVQSLMKFVDCDVTADDFVGLLKLGAVKVSTANGLKGDVDIIKNDLDQTQTQVSKEDLYQAFLNITGMPNRNAGGGTSDTGAAVLLRDGWTLAESHAKSYELQFKKSEREFLKVILKICDAADKTKYDAIDLMIRDIDLAFNRRNYDNILTKSQVLTTMLSTNKIHPLLAFQHCGMFTDPDAAYIMSSEYERSVSAKVEEQTASNDEDSGVSEQSTTGQPEVS